MQNVRVTQNLYAFRCEYPVDLARFILAVQDNCPEGRYCKLQTASQLDPVTPDLTVAIESNLSLAEIGNIMATIEDGHVMIETLNYRHRYTGERNYGCSL